MGALTWFLYVYASLWLSAAYNEMFLVHVVLVSTSLCALALTVRSVRLDDLPPEQAVRLPRRVLARLLVAAGTLTALVWLQPIIATSSSRGAPPMLQNSTTLVTEVLDLALVAPMAVVAGLLNHRRAGGRSCSRCRCWRCSWCWRSRSSPRPRPTDPDRHDHVDFDLPMPSETIACR